MTLVTYGAFRAGVRDAGVTLGSLGGRPFPTPFRTASGSVVRFHRDGPGPAWQWLDASLSRSSYWGPQGTPQARGWADAIRSCFRAYEALATPDTRAVFALGVTRELDLPPHELRVYTDVLLIDDKGYVPRCLLWDTTQLTAELAQLYAAPAWAVAEEELGQGRVPGVEVWHLRTRTRRVVTAAEASAVADEVRRVVHRLTGTP